MTSSVRRVATYERVSSEDQRDRETIKTQTEALARELARNPDVELVQRYADDGVSGTVPMRDRPGGRVLLADAERGMFDELWVYDLTRLARNTADATHIRDTLERWGIAVCWDGRAVDPFIFDVHAALAAEERRRIRRRSIDGMNRAASEGRYVGGIVPFGYRVEGERPRGRLVPDDSIMWGTWTAADVVRLIYDRLANDRWSCGRIAEELNALGIPPVYTRDGRGVRGKRTVGVWRSSRIRNLVVNTTYRGEYQYGKRTTRTRERVLSSVPRLVTDEVWQAAQDTLKANLLVPTNARERYLLRSVMRCMVCGLRYVGTKSHGTTWYRCGGQMKARGKYEGRCPGRSVKGEHLEDVVWADIEAWLRDPGSLLAELDGEASGETQAAVREASRMTLQAAIDALNSRRAKRLEQHERGQISDIELESALEQIGVERREVEVRLADLVPEVIQSPSVPVALVQELHARLDEGLSAEARQEVVQHLVSEIVVSTTVDDEGKKQSQAVIEYRFPPHASDETNQLDRAEGECSSHSLHGCPCGYYGDSVRACTCPEMSVSRYQRRVSGPLMDRIDLFSNVPRVDFKELTGEPSGERSEVVRARVVEARERQAHRFRGTRILTNSEMGPNEVRRYCQEALVPEAQPLLHSAMQQLGLSARAFHRVLKVARTVADLAGSDRIETAHLAESIQYRRRGAD